MKFLVDENLSDKLVARLDVVYPGTKHVKHVRLAAKLGRHQTTSTRSVP